jgi:hypothetical protein
MLSGITTHLQRFENRTLYGFGRSVLQVTKRTFPLSAPQTDTYLRELSKREERVNIHRSIVRTMPNISKTKPSLLPRLLPFSSLPYHQEVPGSPSFLSSNMFTYSFARFRADFFAGDTVRDNLVVTLSSVVFTFLSLISPDHRAVSAKFGAVFVALVVFCGARTVL